MARRYRYEYLMKKRAKERARMEKEERLQNLSSSEKKMRELFGWVAYIVVLVCIVHLTVTYVGQRTVVAGDSMLNTLHDKDNLIIDKVSYRFRDPERYEIIVFPYRHAEETFYIKRIIGLPGETVEIEDGVIAENKSTIGTNPIAGAIAVFNGIVEISGGSIKENTSNAERVDIYVSSSAPTIFGTLIISGGEIGVSGNDAYIYVEENAKFSVENSYEIYDIVLLEENVN